MVALLPTHAASPEVTRLGLLMQARASELVEATGRYSEVHLKQVVAMARQEGLDQDRLAEDALADQARVLLGADRVVTLTLAQDGDAFTLSGAVRDGKDSKAYSKKVPGNWPEALLQGSEAIAQAVVAMEKGTLSSTKAQPESRSDAALKALGQCWETALSQSLSIEAPVALSGESLDAALASCKSAVEADPSLRFAKASLALLQAINREDDGAESTLTSLGDSDAALEPLALARFYLLTRSQSNEAGVAWLKKVLKNHPGELLLQAYVADTLASMNQHSRAAMAWMEYLTLAPNSPYAQGRLSRSLARLNKQEPSLEAAKKALELAPQSHEARLQLASRQVDWKLLDEAMATLKPLVAEQHAPPEAMLRLGWAYWLAGNTDAAAPLFTAAAERASGPQAWRTRGRALYNLALVEAKGGKLDKAKATLLASRETGFIVARPDPVLAEVTKALAAKPAPKPLAAPMSPGSLYVSLEPVKSKAPNVPAEKAALAEQLAKDKLAQLGASFAPAGEEKAAALELIKSKKLKGYQLAIQLFPAPSDGLKADVLVMTYPEKALKGSWSVSANGADVDGLLQAIVPKVLEDAAGDLDWRP